jgi:Fe-S-cluster containining protein
MGWKARSYCVRCGRCCRNSGPTLHQEDLKLIRSDRLPLSSLYTLRRGEWGFSHVHNRPIRLAQERIKIRERSAGGPCLFYEESEHACSVYDHRPIQCRYQACWAPEKIEALLEQPFLSRHQVIPADHPLFELIEAHEQECSIQRFENILNCLADGSERALRPVFEVLQWDLSLRETVVERMDVDPAYLEFLFGRPLKRLLVVHGYQVEETTAGPVLLRLSDR